MKRNENLYTFLFEYKSQKYISQTRASEPYNAILPWALSLDYTSIKGIGNKTKELFLEEIKSLEKDFLVPIEEVKNIWGFGILSRGYALVDLIKTDSGKKKSNLYTFIMDFQGGTYISQIKANTPAKAKLQWSKKMAKQQAGIWKDIQKNKSKQSIDSIPFEMNPSYLNVWNLEFLSGKEKATVYCIKTEE